MYPDKDLYMRHSEPNNTNRRHSLLNFYGTTDFLKLGYLERFIKGKCNLQTEWNRISCYYRWNKGVRTGETKSTFR